MKCKKCNKEINNNELMLHILTDHQDYILNKLEEDVKENMNKVKK